MVYSKKTFKFKVLNYNNRISKEKQLELIESLNIEPFKGKCRLKNPERLYMIAEFFTKELKLK